MFAQIHRLHPRGAANRGICVDEQGAMLGPDCVLVQQTPQGFAGLSRREAATIQKCLFAADFDEDWLFRQTQHIAAALDKHEVALAQIYGLRIPVRHLDDGQLRRIATIGTAKTYNPDEPRIPKGQPDGGEWTSGGETFTPDSGGETAEPDNAGDRATSHGIAVPLLAATADGGSNGSITFTWPDAGAPPPSSGAPSTANTRSDSGPSTMGSPDVGDTPDVAASTENAGSSGANSEGNAAPNPDQPPPPEIPTEKPSTTQQLNAILRAAAFWLARMAALLGPAFSIDPRVRMLLAAIEAAVWMAQYWPKATSYLDEPKTLQELQDAVGTGMGYETHHIVEAQRSSSDPESNWQRFSKRLESAENLVRVPYWKHVQISSWYSTRDESLGYLTPRQYLRRKSWEEQYEYGLRIMRDFGVLK